MRGVVQWIWNGRPGPRDETRYGEQDENGVDLVALRRIQQLTPTERVNRLCETLSVLRGRPSSAVLSHLVESNIPFVIVGDYAAGFYDVELGRVCIEVCVPENLPGDFLLALLEIADGNLLIVHFGNVFGRTFEQLSNAASERRYGRDRIKIASMDDLIAMKKAAGRIKGQLHLLELEAIKKILAEQGETVE